MASDFKLKPSRGRKLVPISLSAVPVALVVSLVSDFGAGAKADYYATVAQVSGTMFVLLLGLVAFLRSHLDIEKSSSYLTHLFIALLAQVSLTLAVCLYAVAADKSSTFLVLSSAIGLAMQLACAAIFAFVTAFPELIARSGEVVSDAPPAPATHGS